MYNTQEIAKAIKSIAKQQNISINQLLSDCELGKNTIAKMANGTDILTKNFAKIVDYLGCSADYLLGRSGNIHELSDEYDRLNENGKLKVQEYIKDLLTSPTYAKAEPSISDDIIQEVTQTLKKDINIK